MLSKVSTAFAQWKESYVLRSQYCGRVRTPYYVLARKYIPEDKDAIIVDLGGGDGGFLRNAGLSQSPNSYLLDGNAATLKEASKEIKNVLPYQAPDRLPFKDSAVCFIHTSHFVEHLTHLQLHKLLKEIDRVLAFKGVLVISTPLLWQDFYGNLTHIKPYGPEVFHKYLCNSPQQLSMEPISRNYAIAELVYRFAETTCEQWGGDNAIVDFLTFIARKTVRKLGFRRYLRTGYTLVLEKNAEHR